MISKKVKAGLLFFFLLIILLYTLIWFNAAEHIKSQIINTNVNGASQFSIKDISYSGYPTNLNFTIINPTINHKIGNNLNISFQLPLLSFELNLFTNKGQIIFPSSFNYNINLDKKHNNYNVLFAHENENIKFQLNKNIVFIIFANNLNNTLLFKDLSYFNNGYKILMENEEIFSSNKNIFEYKSQESAGVTETFISTLLEGKVLKELLLKKGDLLFSSNLSSKKQNNDYLLKLEKLRLLSADFSIESDGYFEFKDNGFSYEFKNNIFNISNLIKLIINNSDLNDKSIYKVLKLITKNDAVEKITNINIKKNPLGSTLINGLSVEEIMYKYTFEDQKNEKK